MVGTAHASSHLHGCAVGCGAFAFLSPPRTSRTVWQNGCLTGCTPSLDAPQLAERKHTAVILDAHTRGDCARRFPRASGLWRVPSSSGWMREKNVCERLENQHGSSAIDMCSAHEARLSCWMGASCGAVQRTEPLAQLPPTHRQPSMRIDDMQQGRRHS